MELDNKKKILGLFCAIILISGGVLIVINKNDNEGDYADGSATTEIVLSSSSTRTEFFSNETKGAIVVADSSPYYALIGTPVALMYKESEKYTIPLNVINKNSPSDGVTKFLLKYQDTENLTTIGIGDVSGGEFPISIIHEINKETLRETSLEIANMFWENSDGVILVRANQEGYNFATVASPLASYLNIPIIVLEDNSIDKEVARVLKELNVDYSLICGDVEGYKKTWKSTWEKVGECVGVYDKKNPWIKSGRIEELKQYAENSKNGEIFHIVYMILLFGIFGNSVETHIINIIGNIYPILLQRYNRGRVLRLIDRKTKYSELKNTRRVL